MCLGWTPYAPSPRLSSEGQYHRFLRYTHFYFYFIYTGICPYSMPSPLHASCHIGPYGPFQPLPVDFMFYLADANKLHPQFWMKKTAAYLRVFYGTHARQIIITRKYTLCRKKLFRRAWSLPKLFQLWLTLVDLFYPGLKFYFPLFLDMRVFDKKQRIIKFQSRHESFWVIFCNWNYVKGLLQNFLYVVHRQQ